jgi:hypothetical protein
VIFAVKFIHLITNVDGLSAGINQSGSPNHSPANGAGANNEISDGSISQA